MGRDYKLPPVGYWEKLIEDRTASMVFLFFWGSSYVTFFWSKNTRMNQYENLRKAEEAEGLEITLSGNTLTFTFKYEQED